MRKMYGGLAPRSFSYTTSFPPSLNFFTLAEPKRSNEEEWTLHQLEQLFGPGL